MYMYNGIVQVMTDVAVIREPNLLVEYTIPYIVNNNELTLQCQ